MLVLRFFEGLDFFIDVEDSENKKQKSISDHMNSDIHSSSQSF